MLRVVVDPEVPADVANLMRRNGPLLSRFHGGWNPEAGTGIPGPVLGVFGATLLLAITTLIAVGAAIAPLMIFLTGVELFILFLLYIIRKPAPADSPERVLYRHATQWRGRFLVLEDFDLPSRQLMGRVQQAIDRILRSRVNSMGLLDSVRNAVMLPAEEWEIAKLLNKLSALRARHHALARGGRIPEVIAAMEPLERALAATEAAVVARVEALERYAGHVTEADRALVSQHQIEAIRAHLPEYEQLVAEAGAGTLLAPEIGHLAQDADQLQRALRDSVRSAHEAFRYLDG
ncbi:hypothetical protein [Planobispora longispora]|uniref:Uncharacterized protein n=1 Tax=Planobispora longispora TaxID=28887 RepID=A0A8J3RS15_9ACTN|nr:hypothetical protein [Planobispora longispora]BFE80922.1 hypothetical protein GCM10020093_035230 [Planobispora longispora]GIH80159.1 hypothetical protein Plo01_65880 [Planobispora longispora]